jgi:hypothetical protein
MLQCSLSIQHLDIQHMQHTVNSKLITKDICCSICSTQQPFQDNLAKPTPQPLTTASHARENVTDSCGSRRGKNTILCGENTACSNHTSALHDLVHATAMKEPCRVEERSGK